MGRLACVLVSRGIHYCRDSWVAGLQRVGFAVHDVPAARPEPDDLLLIWNRVGRTDDIARRYEAAGATVLCAENGWIGADENGGLPFSIAVSYHNGAGHIPVGCRDRWRRWRIDLMPWRTRGSHLLLLPQRGIGPATVAMPPGWVERTRSCLTATTDRKIVVRPHPGGPVAERPPIDWSGVWAAVTWGSGAGVKAICAGVPVLYDMPRWIGAKAASPLRESDIEAPFTGDREPMLERLGWGQWSITEIERGDPFAWILEALASTTAAIPGPESSAKPSLTDCSRSECRIA